MIGVIANSSDHDVVQEFFELFKTPWEFYRADRVYEVVLCAKDVPFEGDAKLVLVYGVTNGSGEVQRITRSGDSQLHSRVLSYGRHRIPIYGDSVTFPEEDSWLVKDEDSQEPAAYLEKRERTLQIRVGYDLFEEVRRLLTAGQPAANAAIPTLELHIALLRDFIVGHRIPLVEIPPVPEGYRFIACLTHDVDHPSIRAHKWDHTAFGFLYRAVFGSLLRVLTGRMSIRNLAKNWWAAFKLPLLHVGLAKDFWFDFGDRYLRLENGIPSTFFMIPFKDSSGLHCDARTKKFRGARYRASELAETIDKLKHAGCEIGLHGTDAWCDSTRGHAELEEIRSLTGKHEIGTRMHWLFYDQESPEVLEMAGATYDSTVGYNETVGYRAGTTQVYKPLNANRLLELPLHVMDTALFYPAYLGLSPQEARTVLDRIVDNATEFGGCITINWHDRSLAPERLWDSPYRELIQDLKDRGAWFATAADCASWFRKRRSVVFDTTSETVHSIDARNSVRPNDNLPSLYLRTHRALVPSSVGPSECLDEKTAAAVPRIPCPASA